MASQPGRRDLPRVRQFHVPRGPLLNLHELRLQPMRVAVGGKSLRGQTEGICGEKCHGILIREA